MNDEIRKQRLEEAKHNYNITIKAIQELQNKPDLKWHEITLPIVKRIHELKKIS